MAAKKKRRKKITWQSQLLGLMALITAVVFMPTTIILFMGMLPTVVAGVIDKSGKGTKALAVGAMNLAGCTPFLIKLWSMGHTSENAVMLISDPRAISVMYAAAGIGYLIDWAMSGIVGTLLVQRSSARVKEIKRRQDHLVERWGSEVKGDLPLDPYGFPVDFPEHGPVDEEKEALESQEKKSNPLKFN